MRSGENTLKIPKRLLKKVDFTRGSGLRFIWRAEKIFFFSRVLPYPRSVLFLRASKLLLVSPLSSEKKPSQSQTLLTPNGKFWCHKKVFPGLLSLRTSVVLIFEGVAGMPLTVANISEMVLSGRASLTIMLGTTFSLFWSHFCSSTAFWVSFDKNCWQSFVLLSSSPYYRKILIRKIY